MVYRFINVFINVFVNRWKTPFLKPKYMHLQIHSAILQSSQTALASWQFDKRHLEKTRLLWAYHVVVTTASGQGVVSIM